MATWICKNCETENDEESIICSTCGMKRDAQSVESRQDDVTPFETRHNQTTGYQTQTSSNQYNRTEQASSNNEESNGDALRELIAKYDSRRNTFKGLVIVFVILQLLLFAFPYVKGEPDYTIYKNAMGLHGSIEQICSILLVCITIAPAVVVCINLTVRKRNLPITISVIVAILTTIYSAVIWFGNDGSTVVSGLIILSAWACVIFAVKLVKTMNELDNAMYRPTGF